MPLVGETGEVKETHGEVLVEWQIPDFFALSEEVNTWYHSPVFGLSDSCWYLRIYPNGEMANMSSGWIGLYLMRADSGPPKTLGLTFGFKLFNVMNVVKEFQNVKVRKKSGMGHSKIFLRSELFNSKSQVMPSNALTVTCSLASNVPLSAEVSLFRRLWNVSRNLKRLLDERKRTDFAVKLKGRELLTHRMILESRCDYFAGMFGHDLLENITGKGSYDDIEEDVFQCVLSYIYSGDVEEMSEQNVCKIYMAAHKLLLKELKKLCTEYMKDNLCLNQICCIIAVANRYEEKELKERAMEYFTKNSAKVIDTDEWMKFKKENATLASELLEDVVKRLQHVKI